MEIQIIKVMKDLRRGEIVVREQKSGFSCSERYSFFFTLQVTFTLREISFYYIFS